MFPAPSAPILHQSAKIVKILQILKKTFIVCHAFLPASVMPDIFLVRLARRFLCLSCPTFHLSVMPDLIGHLIPVISPDSSSVISTEVEKSHQTSSTLPSQIPARNVAGHRPKRRRCDFFARTATVFGHSERTASQVSLFYHTCDTLPREEWGGKGAPRPLDHKERPLRARVVPHSVKGPSPTGPLRRVPCIKKPPRSRSGSICSYSLKIIDFG